MMETQFAEALMQLRLLDVEGLQRLVTEKLRPHYDYQGLLMLRERAVRERDLRELYRGRAPYELLQNADDVGATRAAFVLHPEGLAFLHDGEWFTVRNFENLALGWSDKDPNVCIGNKGLGFRSVLDVTPSPHVLRVGCPGFFGVKFSYALNKGHIDETLNRLPALREEVRSWGAHRALFPVMSIPGPVRRQSLSPAVTTILDHAAQGSYGKGYTTLFWLPATDPDISQSVLCDLGPTPLTLGTGRNDLRAFLTDEVSALILFLQHILEVRLYEERSLAATVKIPAQVRVDAGALSVVTEVDGRQRIRKFFQVRTSVRIPQHVRDEPDTPRTLRAMDRVRIAVSSEIIDGRPVADIEAPFHVYFPTEEPTGVGFLVHGDFYVKPDRTCLMSGSYNDWLFEQAASLAAGPFLSTLLVAHRARDAFEALRPVTPPRSGSAAARFVERFKKALRSRPEPFIPTVDGSRRPDRVVLPPTVDVDGAWDRHVSDELARTCEGRRFLLPSEDSRDARTFLDLAGVERLPAAAFVDLVESAPGELKPASWWYGCYQHMAMHTEIGRWTRERFAGRRIVPISGGAVAAVPNEMTEAILILPPRGRTDLPEPPESFAWLLRAVEPALADLLWGGDEAVRTWVASRFHVATFEVGDFLPRVVQAVTPQLFTDNGAPSAAELAAIWRFVRRYLEAAARPIHDEAFWNVIGRLPVPTILAGDNTAPIATASLVPIFLTYFPDEWLEDGRALVGVRSLRRIAPEFLTLLAGQDASERTSWRELLERTGVSFAPKVLRYRRIVPGPQVLLTSEPPDAVNGDQFVGRRQQDENRAVLDLLRAEGLWPALVAGAPRCRSHPQNVVLGEVTLVEGLAACVAQAVDKNRRKDSRWIARLCQLARELPADTINAAHVVTFCSQCRQEAHAPGGAPAQLERQHWVPTTFGPWAKREAFLRLVGRRLIGIDPDGAELGDRLLPYAVADTIDDYGRLTALGVAPLDDPGSASPATLLRFLASVGRALTDERTAQEFVGVRARWRLIRGAIQEVYRSLNRQAAIGAPKDLRLAVRTPAGVRFRPAPWYFAAPGSAIERAFGDQLNIIDADRPYATLFQQLGVVTLAAGQTVNEELVHAAKTQMAARLHEQIVGELAPFLLALVVSRSDDPHRAELVARRLRERFSVRTARSLRLALALTDGSARTEITVEPFYLQRTVVVDAGRREATHTLYAVGEAGIDLFAIDGDALGMALAPVFLDGLSEELASLFPCLVTRFQLTRGQVDALESFLLYQLGVTVEAQATAGELLRGERSPAGASGERAPAPRIVVGRRLEPDGLLTVVREAALSNLRQTYQAAEEQIAARLALQDDGRAIDHGRHAGVSSARTVTHEEEERGLRGEEEMKRRLQQPEGWARFRLVQDRRKDGCGYDFLCDVGGAEAKLEVKAFVPGGRVIVTLRELQEAYTSRRTYYLVGLCDNGGPSSTWEAVVLQDPIEQLLLLGDFQLETTLKVPSEHLFAAQPEEGE